MCCENNSAISLQYAFIEFTGMSRHLVGKIQLHVTISSLRRDNVDVSFLWQGKTKCFDTTVDISCMNDMAQQNQSGRKVLPSHSVWISGAAHICSEVLQSTCTDLTALYLLHPKIQHYLIWINDSFPGWNTEAYTCTDVLFVGGEKVRVHVSKSAPQKTQHFIFWFAWIKKFIVAPYLRYDNILS